MKELEPMLKREGRVFPNGMADIVPIAHPRWKQLPEKEKERFENMARREKARLRGVAGDDYRQDNVGNKLSERKDKYTELEKKRMAEKKDIIRNWPEGKDLKKEKFYFIHFQYMCKTEEEDPIFLPAEIGVIEYSIEKGIMRHLHRFINPGKIPVGYRFTCIQHSEDTHQIPIENWDLFDSNYTGLWIQLENFINPEGKLPANPPLYCLGAGHYHECVEKCLEWIHGRACLGEPNRIRRVYEVESLFQEMYAHVGEQVSKTQCIDRLTCSDWDYEPNTRCQYHEEKEVKHCALGVVNRYAFAMSDSLCTLFDVQLTKKHIPIREDTGAITVLSPSSMPVCAKQESRLPARSELPFKTKEPKHRDAEEEDYRELRRPKPPVEDVYPQVPAAPAWGGAMGRGSIPMGGAMGGVMGRGSAPVGGVFGYQDFPPMGSGRGLNVAMQGLNLDQGKHAGRASAPKPSAAPIPPQAWQHPSFPAQQPVGVGRGLIFASAPPPSTPYTADDDDNITPLRLPGQRAPTLGPISRPDESLDARYQSSHVEPIPLVNGVVTALPMGRGRGGILEGLLKQGRKQGTPVGRGFAPPDWEDDGSLGPMRRS